MGDNEIRTDTYTESMARAAWNEALRRLGWERQPYTLLDWRYAGDGAPTSAGRPADVEGRSRVAVQVLELALELAVAFGRENGRIAGEDYSSLVQASERTDRLLRRATALLSDIQKKDGEIAAVLNDYSTGLVDAAADRTSNRLQFEEYRFPNAPSRCTTYCRRLTPPVSQHRCATAALLWRATKAITSTE